MVMQVTDTEPTMARSSCWSMPEGCMPWLSKLGTGLRSPVGTGAGSRLNSCHPAPPVPQEEPPFLPQLQLGPDPSEPHAGGGGCVVPVALMPNRQS